jgi:hypothetical protein
LWNKKVEENYMAMKWFGDWSAPITEVCEKTSLPPGIACTACESDFEPDDIGVSMPYVRADGTFEEVFYHRVCLMRHMGLEEGAVSSLRQRTS